MQENLSLSLKYENLFVFFVSKCKRTNRLFCCRDKINELHEWMYQLESEKFDHMERLKMQKYEVRWGSAQILTRLRPGLFNIRRILLLLVRKSLSRDKKKNRVLHLLSVKLIYTEINDSSEK